MAVDIFEFWRKVPPGAHAHPLDGSVFARVTKHDFELEALPWCFSGPLRTAPVVSVISFHPALVAKTISRRQH
jgi:hypothetical protein